MTSTDPIMLCGATVTRDRGYSTTLLQRKNADRCNRPPVVEVIDENGRWYLSRCRRHAQEASRFIEGVDGLIVREVGAA